MRNIMTRLHAARRYTAIAWSHATPNLLPFRPVEM